MEGSAVENFDLVGRDGELAKLMLNMDMAIAGQGSAVFVSGEAGVGKTSLTDAFKKMAAGRNVTVLSGAADSDSNRPFRVLSKALGGLMDKPLFEERELKKFVKIFAVNRAGLLIAQASSEEEELDADIFAGMLSAVQDFVRDSFEREGGSGANLGRLEYGDMKILMEHGEHLFLTTVFRGDEHPDMKGAMKRTLREIEEKNSSLLRNWAGKMAELAPVQDEIMRLADVSFLVRMNLEGVKLENERIRIADEVFEALKRTSAKRPAAVFLEDLHWADESSLFVINYLARNIRRYPILLMGTLRPGESDALRRTMDGMKNEGILEELALEKLDMDLTKSLIESAFAPNDFPDTLAGRLYEQSRGNPLFVTEILKGMLQEGSIAKRDGKYTLVSESYHVPATVEEVVNRRLESLDPDSMAMVEYASCIGQRFDVSMAESNPMVKDPGASMGKLLTSGILSRKNGTAEFSHAVFQSVIYDGIGERWRAGHHKSLGEYLESAYADRPDEVMYDLARHFSRTREHGKSFAYCMSAGEKAESSFAVEQALEFYNGALAAISKLNADDATERISDIMERIGDIRTAMGDYETAIKDFQGANDATGQSETKARTLRKAAEVHEKMGEYDETVRILERAKGFLEDGKTPESGRVLRAEGLVHYRKGEYDAGLALFGAALKVFEHTGAGQKDMGETFRLIGNIHGDKGRYDDALRHYEKSLAIMEELGDHNGIAAALADMGGVHRHRGEDDKALEYHERSLEIREKVGDRQGIARSLNNIGIMHWQKGRLDEALASFGRSLEMLDRMGDRHRVAISLNNIGGVHQNRGELHKALEYYERSLAIKEKIGDKSGVASSLASIGGVWHTLGELDKALELLGRSLDIREEIGDKTGAALALNNIGEVHHYKCQPEKAKEFLERSLAICLEIGERWLSVHDHCIFAEVCIALGENREALGHAESALAISEEIEARSEEGMSRRVLGAVWREMKDPEKAGKEFEMAGKILSEVENMEELAKLSYERALLHNAEGDPAKARKCLDEALAEFQRMGMRLWEQRCRKALDGL